MKIKENVLSFLKIIEINLISIITIILTIIFFYILNFKQITGITKRISNDVNNLKLFHLKIDEIHKHYSKIRNFLRINSCFKNCISLKIIFSYYGVDVAIIGGIRLLRDKSVDGHAWLRHKEIILFDDQDKIQEFQKSFEI